MKAFFYVLVLLLGVVRGFVHNQQVQSSSVKTLTTSSNGRCRQLQVDATKSATSSSSRQKEISSLLDWAKTAANIQQAPSIALQADDDAAGLGWFATATIQPNTVLLSVPSSVALTVENPGEGPDDAGVAKNLFSSDNDGRKMFRDDMPWFVQMSLYLFKLDQLDSVKNGVDMRPWLDCLPRQFDTPIHWSATERAALQYPYMQDAVQRQETTWRSHHQRLVAAIVGTHLSWDDFLWGCECARSRAFSGGYTGTAFNPLIYAFTLLLVTVYVGLHLGTLEQAANGAGVVLCASILKDFVLPKLFKTKKYVICPVIDMTNHQSKFPNKVAEVAFEYFANAYSLASSSSSSVAAGDQVYISYGARSNDQLLQYYGFVETDNPHDVYVMPSLREWDIGALEEACGRSFAAGRLEKLDRAGLLGSSVDSLCEDDENAADEVANAAGGVVLTRSGGIDPAVLQALRALVSTEAEWEAAGQAIGNFAEELSGGKENERCARLAARRAIELELEAKETTVEEDKKRLMQMESMKGLDTSRADILALQFRIEKKKLLEEAIRMLK